MIRYVTIVVLLLSFAGCEQKEIKDDDDKISLSKAMGDVEEENFSKAIDKREFILPTDHGPHPDFRTEWWYFTGNLVSDEGREFGYQFTIFRTALTKNKPKRNSDWNSNQIYMAHFAVTDISNNKFYFDERFSREGNNLAGAQVNPLKVWLEDWEIIQVDEKFLFNLPRIKLKAKTDEAEINFRVEALKPLVLQGDSGLSQKGKENGNASYYYSYTRLKTSGKIILDGNEYEVTGFSWMDREWSTSALSEDQAGWDWFALQLGDSSEIMYYQMRKNNGSPDIFSRGVMVNQKGLSEPIKKEDVVLRVTNNWKTTDGTNYPSGWTLQIPSENIDLKITPAIKDQFLDVSIKYWEGSVKIEGTKNGNRVNGRGYVELTGY